MNPAITYRHVIVRLLNGPIYQEDLDLWGRLGAEWDRIKSHFFDMGLEVARDDAAGYAFVRQTEESEEELEDWEDVASAPLPRVLRRTRLSYHQTIFMVIFLGSMILAMFVWIIPKFSEVYSQLGASLPGPTKKMMNANHRELANILKPLGLYNQDYQNQIPSTYHIILIH